MCTILGVDGGVVYWRSLVTIKALLSTCGCIQVAYLQTFKVKEVKHCVFKPLLIWMVCLMQLNQFLIDLNYN